ncbi:cadmium resistance transporter [Corynebacterium aquilae]|uniref:Cadmium transporter n=1 Tax=Corynebacterium aquilae DSM 44791 TaxID=1431546 RepID=A0A1L7CIV1_9CORY|nr:cadmium resistance transporter [Corynebacterium aquilae]APT85738.1 cadmium transporter [Corynebacterium aquilae DSM 44791]
MITAFAQAVGLFAATNIDDIIVLSLFFARGARQKHITRTILLGQYLGFLAILITALAIAWGAGTFLPSAAIPYFGLIPLALGLKAAYEALQGEDEEDFASTSKVTALTIAAITFANGGDNIGVYVPVFLSLSPASITVFCVVFLILVAALVFAARWITTRPGIDEILERWERVLFPVVLIGLGLTILIKGGAFGI